MAHPLDGAFEKMRRAKVHRDALRRSIKRMQERRPVPLRAEFDPKSGYYLFRIAVEPKLPMLRWGVMIGDVFHNLRSVLDYIAWALAHEGSRVPPKPRLVQFPIYDAPNEFSGSYLLSVIDQRHIGRLEGHQPFKPWQGPDHYSGPYIHPLALLRDLSNDDKHRLVTPILARSSMYRTWGNLGRVVDFGDARQAFELDTVVMRVMAPAGVPAKQEPYGEMAPAILLPGPRDLIMSIDRCAAYTLKVLREFEPLL